MRTDTPPRILLRNYRPPDYLVDSIDLDIALDPRASRVRARLEMRRNPAARRGRRPLVLDGEKLALVSLRLDGAPLAAGDYEVGARALTVAEPPAGSFVLDIETVCDPQANTELTGLYISNGIYCTQCEAEGFRRITYFPDRPDVLAVYTVRIEADRDAAPVLLSNGNPVDFGETEDNRHFVVWHDPFPKPSYLFALVGGTLACLSDSHITAHGRWVALNIFVEPGKEARCAYAMAALKRAMRWDEERFGREYDLDVFNIVAVSDFNMGAMENKGLNIFNDKFVLAAPDTATDDDYAAIEAIVAHEYFHNWTGNRITCRDWFQLCLKEGLTVFRDQEFSADMRSRPVVRIGDVKQLRQRQFSEDAGPLAHPVRPESFIEINNFYTPTVYEKGAELVRMIQTMLGREAFRAGMDLYFARHDGQAATVEDFLRCFEDAAGADLGQFRLWYSQAGTPELVVGTSWDERAGTFAVEVEQIVPPTPGQPKKKPMHIPLALGLLGPDGRELPLVTADGARPGDGILHVRRRRETFRFAGLAARPVPSLLRDFSAPVRLTTNLADDDLLFLLAADGDPFNRWQAAQELALRWLVAACRAGAAAAAGDGAERFAGALGRALADEALEPALRALLAELPGEGDIAMALGADVDPDRVRAAREALRRRLAGALEPALAGLYERLRPNAPYAPDAAAAGRRALRNAALALLVAPGDEAAIARLAAHYESADNMTDMMAALGLVTHAAHERRDAMLDDFYRRFEDEPLVVDKWFSLQAVAARPDTVERVAALAGHPAFRLENPNRARALFAAFATLNPTGFHRADGAGYRLVADTVVALDRINPQIAARLLGAFKSWRQMDAGRRTAAGRVLRKLAARKGLSRDVAEIATAIA